MARIAEAVVERLKSEVSVERLVEAAGIELKRGGKDLLGRCPFHEDDTASLVVTPAKNLWRCFGCGIGGGPIDWVIKRNGVSFRHAVELLKAYLSLAAGTGDTTGALKRSQVRKLAAPVALDGGEQEALDQVIGYYHQTLLATSPAASRSRRTAWASPTGPWACGCRRRRARSAPNCEAACRRSACCATRGTSTSTAVWSCR
jgi:DNA primase